MDVAWFLGSGSQTCDWELRMSMRSFRMHYLAAAKPWIIGYIPDWIDTGKVRCIPWPDPYRRCKDANLLHKALRLAMEPELTDAFILCCDDFLLLRPSSSADFKLWHDGEIPTVPQDGFTKWQLRLFNTGQRLRDAGYRAMNFDAHVPYPLRKDWIKEALRFDFAVKPGMCVYSTIINCTEEPGEAIQGKHIRGWMGEPNISTELVDKRLARNLFACLAEKSIENSYLISRVEDIFSIPAPWELDAAVWPRRSEPTSVCNPWDSPFGFEDLKRGC